MAVNILEPDAYQIFQRDGSDVGDIVIIGTYSVGVETGVPQARFNGGAWTTLTDPVAGGGDFSGTLANQPTGQGTLEVRMSGAPGTVDTKIHVGIGDVFVVAGQSNASGRGSALQVYDPGASSIRAGNYRNNHTWAQLTDPFDQAYPGTDDVVSEDLTAGGSWVPRVTTRFISEVGGVDDIPIGFIPVAKGGSFMSQWNRVIDSDYLYGSMWKRVVQGAYGRIKAVLWFQGEQDSNTPRDTYAAMLSQFATDVFNDFGVPTIAALIGPYPLVSTNNYRIGPRGGALKAIDENEHLLMGPAFYDVDYDADLHYETTANINMAGDRFWGAVKDHFYGGDGSGIGPAPFIANYDVVENTINLDFAVDIGSSTADDGTFTVVDSTGEIVTVDGPCRSGDRTVRLPLADVPLGEPQEMTVTYGLDNRGGVGATIYGTAGAPAVPVLEFAVSGNPAPDPVPDDLTPGSVGPFPFINPVPSTPPPKKSPMTTLYPSDIIGPHFQKLTLPVDGPDSGPYADEIVPARLDTYTSLYCRLAADNSILHRVYHGGATTKGSDNPRSEWRETNTSGNLYNWDGRRNRHKMLCASMSINRLTPVKPDIVLAQIHGLDDDLTVLRAEGIKSGGVLTNNIKMWITDGDNTHAHFLANVTMTQKFRFGFDVYGGRVHFYWNGVLVRVSPGGAAYTIAAQDGCYFKTGLYLQSNPGTAPGESTKNYAEARIFGRPTVSHTAA